MAGGASKGVGRFACGIAVLVLFVTGTGAALVPIPATNSGSVPTTSSPVETEATRSLEGTDIIPPETLVAAFHQMAQEAGGSEIPGPDSLPGFAELTPADQQRALDGWLRRILEDRATRPSWSPQTVDMFDQAAPTGEGTSEMFGLRSLWRVEGHGLPRFLLPADDQGGTFLVTSQAVLRYEAPGASASWLVKPQGSLTGARAADANGDDALDVVVGMAGAFGSDWETVPTLAVVDGNTGGILFEGLAGVDQFLAWDLTDVDGDGALDLVGVDALRHAVARKLDGTVIYREPMRDAPDVEVPDPVDVYLQFQAAFSGLVDVTGDGVLDVVSTFRHDADAYLPVPGTDGQLEYEGAYDGTTGQEIWFVPIDAAQTFSSSRFFGGADVDGDGLDDVAVVRFGTYSGTGSSIGPLSMWRTTYISGLVVVGGADGIPLIRDQERTTSYQVGPAPPLDVPMGEFAYFPVGIADLDGDGAAEILAFEGEEGTDMALVARGPGEPKGGASQVRFRVPFELPAYDSSTGEFKLRDVDGDGTDELVVALTGVVLDDHDQPTQMESRLLTFKGRTLESALLPRLLGLWDFDVVNRQPYGWTMEDDRWTALDGDGSPQGNSTRILVSPYPIGKLDVTGDGVPDLLFRKSMGVMWSDGSTGELLQDVPRPAGRAASWAFETGGRLQLLEYAFGSRTYYLTDLEDGRQIWRLTPEQREGGFFLHLVDFTGDDIIDAGFMDFRADGEPYWVRDLVRDEVVFRVDTEDTFFPTVFDADPARPGEELFFEYWRSEAPVRLAAYNVAEEEPIWTIPGSLGRFVEASGGSIGYVVIRALLSEPGSKVQILHAANGTLVKEWNLGEGQWLRSASFEHLSGDATPELVAVVGDSTQPVTQYSLLAYPVAPGGPLFEQDLEPGFSAGLASTPNVGDWDGDAWSEILLMENGRPTIRGGHDGRLVGAGPRGSSVAMTYDPNEDGRMELVVLDSTDRLRLFTQATGTNATVDEDVFRVIDDPDRALVEEGAEEFFSDVKGKSAGPGALLGLAALSAAVVAARRRR